MDFKQYKMSSVTFGKYTANMPIDPEIERFVAARMSEKIEMALGIPQTHQQEVTLTMDHFRNLVKDYEDTFVVNIDDALKLFRLLKSEGFKVRRGITAMGNKGSFFYVYISPILRITVLIDIWRHTPRGQMMAFNNRMSDWKIGY